MFMISHLVRANLVSPRIVCIETNTKETIRFIKEVFSTLHFSTINGSLEIEISFENCTTLKYRPTNVT
ncbi:MAG: hypothetical protein ACJATI_003749 [Halioglobus sp.]|jgi:hypothetical protein